MIIVTVVNWSKITNKHVYNIFADLTADFFNKLVDQMSKSDSPYGTTDTVDMGSNMSLDSNNVENDIKASTTSLDIGQKCSESHRSNTSLENIECRTSTTKFGGGEMSRSNVSLESTSTHVPSKFASCFSISRIKPQGIESFNEFNKETDQVRKFDFNCFKIIIQCTGVLNNAHLSNGSIWKADF